jgi:hypothetical protein
MTRVEPPVPPGRSTALPYLRCAAQSGRLTADTAPGVALSSHDSLRVKPALRTPPPGITNQCGYQDGSAGAFASEPYRAIVEMVPTPPRCAGGLKTSMSRFVAPSSSKPDVMSVRPSGSSVWVGYQRPCGMLGCAVHVSVHGLNV